jgi:hypothetical protein
VTSDESPAAGRQALAGRPCPALRASTASLESARLCSAGGGLQCRIWSDLYWSMRQHAASLHTNGSRLRAPAAAGSSRAPGNFMNFAARPVTAAAQPTSAATSPAAWLRRTLRIRVPFVPFTRWQRPGPAIRTAQPPHKSAAARLQQGMLGTGSLHLIRPRLDAVAGFGAAGHEAVGGAQLRRGSGAGGFVAGRGLLACGRGEREADREWRRASCPLPVSERAMEWLSGRPSPAQDQGDGGAESSDQASHRAVRACRTGTGVSRRLRGRSAKRLHCLARGAGVWEDGRCGYDR